MTSLRVEERPLAASSVDGRATAKHTCGGRDHGHLSTHHARVLEGVNLFKSADIRALHF